MDDAKTEATMFWFGEEMEQCRYCREWLPWDKLEAPIGMQSMCHRCLVQFKQNLLWKLREKELLHNSLGLS